MLRLFWGVVSLVFVISCQKSPVNEALNAPNSSGIINGREVKESEPLAKSIVAVWGKSSGMCTGTLLPDNIVVTAAHCLEGKPSGYQIVFATNPEDILSTREPDILKEKIRNVVAFQEHEDYEQALKENREYDHHDIGLLKFSGSVPEGYEPAKLLTDIQDLQIGKEVTVAGFGDSLVEMEDFDPKNMSEEELDELMMAGEITCDDDYQKCQSVKRSGDSILKVAKAPIQEILESEVRLDETKAGTCTGDSGGPAYLERGGELYLFGVTSRGSVYCDTDGVYTNILNHKDWLEKTIQKLQQLPGKTKP